MVIYSTISDKSLKHPQMLEIKKKNWYNKAFPTHKRKK